MNVLEFRRRPGIVLPLRMMSFTFSIQAISPHKHISEPAPGFEEIAS
jgi:hypothetical protein